MLLVGHSLAQQPYLNPSSPKNVLYRGLTIPDESYLNDRATMSVSNTALCKDT